MIRRTLIYIRNFLIAVILLVIAYLLLVIVVNWKDQPPSATVKAFEQSIISRSTITYSENGFIYFLGLEAPENIDPIDLGIERSDWMLKVSDQHLEIYDDFPQNFDELEEYFSPELNIVVNACKKIDKNCMQSIEEHKTILSQWFHENTWLVERYHQLIGYSLWDELPILNINMPMPRYSHVINLQRLYYIHIVLNENHYDSFQIAKILNEDLKFWKNTLANNKYIISKLISAAAIRSNFNWANIILTQYFHHDVDISNYSSLIIPFNDQELSMQPCYIGEWIFSKNIFSYANEMEISNIELFLSKFLFQEQDYRNHYAELMLEISSTVDVDINNFESAIHKLKDEDKPKSYFEKLISPYNMLGKHIIDSIPVSQYGNYASAVKDLEGARRALLLSLKLLTKEDVDFSSAQFSNPYNNQPLIHDKDDRVITFQGLSPSDRHIYQYSY